MKIAIVGSGVDGCLTALLLNKKLNVNVADIVLVRGNVQQTRTAMSSTVLLKRVHDELNIDEPSFVRQTLANVSLARCISGIRANKKLAYVSADDHGFKLNNYRFSKCAAKLINSGAQFDYSDFSLASCMAKRNCFTLPSQDASSILSQFTYGYQFDAIRYQSFLLSVIQQQGIKFIDHAVTNYQFDQTTNLGQITLDNDQQLTADVFIDASESVNHLFAVQHLQQTVEDVSDRLPHAVLLHSISQSDGYSSVPHESLSGGESSHSSASGHWIESLSLASNFYRTEYVPVTGDTHNIPEKGICLRSEYRKSVSQSGVFALGRSVINLPHPFFSIIDLVSKSVDILMDNLPGMKTNGQLHAVEKSEYSPQIIDIAQQQIDYAQVLNWLAAKASNQPYASELSERLAHRLALFAFNGTVAGYDNDLYGKTALVNLLLCADYWPTKNDTHLERASLQFIEENLNKMYQRITGAANAISKRS